MLIGYGKVDEDTIINSRTSNVKISIDHQGRTSTFETATQFGDFLNHTPEIAEYLLVLIRHSMFHLGPALASRSMK
jgi:hypothetical protein